MLAVVLAVECHFIKSSTTFQNDYKHKKTLENSMFSRVLAEKEGFEPSRQLSHPTPLAGYKD